MTRRSILVFAAGLCLCNPAATTADQVPTPTLDFIRLIGKSVTTIRSRSDGAYIAFQAESNFPFFARARVFKGDLEFTADAFDLTGNPWPRVHVGGVALDRDDQSYVAMAYYPTPLDLHFGVSVYSKAGQFLRSWDLAQNAGGIAMAPDSTLWIALGGNPPLYVPKIVHYDRMGGFLGEFVCVLPPNIENLIPIELYCDGAGQLVTLFDQTGSSVLRRYTTTGAQQTERIFAHATDGELLGMSIDRAGLCYCSHYQNRKLLILDRAFQDIGSFGGLCTENELTFTRSAVDLNCALYVFETDLRSIRGLRTDADGDGLCDSWEVFGLLAGASTLPLPTANPMHRDVYVEVDAMEHHAMRPEAVDSLVAAFGRVPNDLLSPPNPNNEPGITLHVDLDESDLTDTHWTLANRQQQFAAFKGQHFGPANDASLRAAKQLAYHYCVFAHGATDPHSPVGEGEPGGNEFYVARGAGGGGEERGSWQDQAGSFMHELGHNLALFHGGMDGINFKPNYRSVMNYLWQLQVKYAGENVEPQWYLSYSNRPFNELNEACLNEPAGIGGDPGRTTFITPTIDIGSEIYRIRPVPEVGRVDFDRSGSYSGCAENVDINRALKADGTLTDPTPGEDLLGQNDWAALLFADRYSQAWLRDAYRFNSSEADVDYEMTYELLNTLRQLRSDCDGDGLTDSLEIAAGEPDSDCNGIPDGCDWIRAELSAPSVVLCPGGDADTLHIRVDLLGVCAVDTSDPQLAIKAVRTDGRSDTLRLWTALGAGVSVSDTLFGSYDVVTKQALVSIVAGSGCGRAHFDVYAGGLRLAAGLECDIHALDWDRRVVGAVDRFDLLKWDEALARQDIGDCGDFDGDTYETEADQERLQAHQGHARLRQVVAPNGGESWAVGSTHSLSWVPGMGDSARVSLFVRRTSVPAFIRGIVADILDTGAMSWVVDANLPNETDYTIEVAHTAGYRDAGPTTALGSDQSDLPFAITGSTVAVDPSPSVLPVQFALDAGRPNPFHKSLIIGFALPSRGRVKLDVFDLQGRNVRRLADAEYEAGRWSVEWDGRDPLGRALPAGIYVYRLSAGQNTAQRKSLLLR